MNWQWRLRPQAHAHINGQIRFCFIIYLFIINVPPLFNTIQRKFVVVFVFIVFVELVDLFGRGSGVAPGLSR